MSVRKSVGLSPEGVLSDVGVLTDLAEDPYGEGIHTQEQRTKPIHHSASNVLPNSSSSSFPPGSTLS